MFSWLWDAYTIVKEALGLLRLTIINRIGTAVVAITAFYFAWTGGFLSRIETGLLFGVLLVSSVLAMVINYTVVLRRQNQPKVKLTCAGDGCIVTTPVQILGDDGRPRWASKTVYVRVSVTNLGTLAAADCLAMLISVQKKGADGSFEPTPFQETIDLAWSMRGNRGFEPLTIGRHDKRFFDVLQANMDQGSLLPCGEWPMRLGDLFTQPGTYRLGVAVRSSDGVSQALSFDVVWNGKWNEIRVSDVPNG